jgi:N6-L-threonylcarbamoyladenine synthase
VMLFTSKDNGIDASLGVKDIAASFQAAVVDALVQKTIHAARENNIGKIVVAGGVAANSSLRKRMKDAADGHGIKLYLPSMDYCIDNAAMIALAGFLHYQKGERSGLDLNPRASMPLGK